VMEWLLKCFIVSVTQHTRYHGGKTVALKRARASLQVMQVM
jgi:hypothetical protein